MKDLPVIFLMGPTAAGKTGLGVDLAQRLPVEIVSVDSAMVYRGMDIGTAKPPPDILRIAPHHLIDICDPAAVYSAALFRDDAINCIDQIHARGRIPLLIGGTGLYFRALEQGLSALPPGNADMRKRLEMEAESIGWEAMHARLADIDPQAASHIHARDPQRIQRALEVYMLTGRPITAHFREELKQPLPWKVTKMILVPSDRGLLHQQVEQRFLQMLEKGLLDEVRRLRARTDLHAGRPAMRLVGYRQAWACLEGKLQYEEMITRAVIATRQLVKRQLTWLRKEQGGCIFDCQQPDLRDKILIFLKHVLKSG